MTQEALKLARQLLWRYRHETPIGNQPHMICQAADEAFKRIDEALAQPEQEPVAVVDVHEFYDNCANFSLLQKLPKGKHTLYTTPPQRKEPPDWFHAVENILNEYGLQAIDFVADFKAAMKDAEHSQRTWVGLTDEEIKAMDAGLTSNASFYAGALWAEAKLKEKNFA